LRRQNDSSFYNTHAAGKKKNFETAATCFKNLRLINVRCGVKPGKKHASRTNANDGPSAKTPVAFSVEQKTEKTFKNL
jgi:hypothetical protein